MALLRFKMDKTFMRFDVSTKKSDECMILMQDSCKEESVIQRQRERKRKR